MRVLVCGGRDYADWPYLNRTLTMAHALWTFDYLIHGGATGADRMAGTWAKNHSIPTEVFPADWLAHGRAAGPLRNREMLDKGKPDLVVAFPGGRGTDNMVKQAEARGIHTYRA